MIITEPNMESKFHIEVQQGKLCVHRLDVELWCQPDVGGFASRGRPDKGMSPQIRWGLSKLQMGWSLMTAIGCSLTKASDVECPPRTETSVGRDGDSIGL